MVLKWQGDTWDDAVQSLLRSPEQISKSVDLYSGCGRVPQVYSVILRRWS